MSDISKAYQREYSKRWYRDNHEHRLAYLAEYRAKNRDKLNQRQREYYAANREKVREYNRQYREAHRERIREQSRQSAARLRAKKKLEETQNVGDE